MSTSSTVPDAHMVADIVPFTARSLLGLMEDRGVSPERLCRGLGFIHADLLDRHLQLSPQQVRSLILRAHAITRDPALGLACGARQTPVSWGLLGLAMLTCETFGEAIEYGLAQQGAGGAMLHNVFEVRGREAHLDVTPRLFDLEVENFLVEENFAGAVAVSRYLVGAEFAPLRIDLAFPKPPHEELYRRFFRCPVRFDAGRSRMTIESHWLGARLPGYDRITCGLVREQLNTLLQSRLAAMTWWSHWPTGFASGWMSACPSGSLRTWSMSVSALCAEGWGRNPSVTVRCATRPVSSVPGICWPAPP